MVIKNDRREIKVSDYTVLVKNIPINFHPENEDYIADLKQFFEGQGLVRAQVKVARISLIYSLQKMRQLEGYIMLLIEEKQAIYQQRDKSAPRISLEIEKINQKIAQTNADLDELEAKFQEGRGEEFIAAHFTGKALISFHYESGTSALTRATLDKKKVLKQNRQSIWQRVFRSQQTRLLYHGNYLLVEVAFE